MEDLIVRLCEDRRSWLFVIAGTLGLCLVFVLPFVDEYVAVCAEKSDIEEQLALADHAAQMLAGFEKRRAEQVEVVARRIDQTLNENNEADYRNTILKVVRDTGCQLRRLNIGVPSARNWGQGDDPLAKSANKSLKPTSFQLERRQVHLSLVGSSANVRRLIERIEQHQKVVHVETMDMKPSGGDGRRVELSMELWYFTLNRPAA